MQAFPKELIGITEEYTGEPGVLPLFYSENVYKQIPRDVQKTIAGYIEPVDYADLALRAEMGLDTELSPEKYKIVRMPWSREKKIQAREENLYPILRQAYLDRDIPHANIELFKMALDNRDIPFLLLMIEEDPLYTNSHISIILNLTVFRISSKLLELQQEGDSMSAKVKDNLLSSIARENDLLDFLISILPEGRDYSDIYESLIRQADKLKNFDLIVKLGHLAGFDKPFTKENLKEIQTKGFNISRAEGSLGYLRNTMLSYDLKNELRRMIRDLATHPTSEGEQVLIEVLSSYPEEVDKKYQKFKPAS